jgi:ABC-type glycerol-3-phosphate transport system substrate-binding protein
MREIVRAFNAAHGADLIHVEIAFFPDFQYAEKLAVAAAARDLPDAFDLDGPLVARWAQARLLSPLEPWFSPAELDDFLPTLRTQGTIDGRLYALGAFESAVVLYYDRSFLERAGVTLPPDTGPNSAWSWDEFIAACRRLKDAGFEPISLHMDESADEWYTYAFTPVLWSGGGDLIGSDGRTVRGWLASEANRRSVRAWQEIFRRGFAAAAPVDPDPFGHGTTALDWSGHWMARSHLRSKGKNLGAMPLPRLGDRAAAPSGSWCWAISAGTRQPDGAAEWLRWITNVEHGIVPLVRANGAVPGRRSAFGSFPEYQEMPYRLFRAQLETVARPRPRTPFYAALTQNFAAALRDIARGADVDARLRLAEDETDRTLRRRAPAISEATVVQANFRGKVGP